MRRRREEHDAARKARRTRSQQAHSRRMASFRLHVTFGREALAGARDELTSERSFRGGSARAYDWLGDDAVD